MPLPKNLQNLSIEELRTLAAEYQLPKAGGLSKASLLFHLESIQGYEARTVGDLQSLLRERGFRTNTGLRKRQITRLLHRFDVLSALTADELRRRAVELEIPQTKKHNKAQLVVMILERETDSLTPDRAPAKVDEGPSPSNERASSPSSGVFQVLSSRYVGRLLMFSGAFFITLSLVSMIVVPLTLIRAFQPAQLLLTGVSDRIEGAQALIDNLALALDNTVEAIGSSASSLQSVSQTLDASQPLIDSTDTLLGTALPDSIEATQAGLLEAEDSARALDQVLRGLAALGPITGVRYDPDVPLHEGIAGTAEGLDPLPAALIDVRDQLVTATADLEDLTRNLRATAAAMRKLNTDLQRQGAQLDGLKQTITTLGTNVNVWEQSLPATFLMVGLLTEFILVGLLATQVAVFSVGQSIAGTGEKKGVIDGG